MVTEQVEVIDHEETSQALATRPAVSLVPTTTAAELVQRLDVIRGAMSKAMQRDVDYGVIPGTGKKPTLLKPGAEKLAVLFQLDVQLENEKLWHDDGHLTVVCRATVFHIPTGSRVASGEGICTTREAKYAFRNVDRVCPVCGAAAIIKGKAEYGGGWLCWKNHKTTPGCGAKFAQGDAAIEGQQVGKADNENIADTYNTVDKMASKRARVDAVLAATGASALFTQDAEDLQTSSGGPQAGPDSGATKAASASVSQAEPEPASPDGWFPPDPDEPPVELATAAQKKKLNVLVGKLRPDHITTEQLWQAHFLDPVNGLGEDGRVHWAPLRDRLTSAQAHALIDRLSVLETRVGEAPSFAEMAEKAQAARADA